MPTPFRERLVRLRHWLLPTMPPVSRFEKLAAVAAAFIAILLLAASSAYFLEGSTLFLVGSMGASAVLLFATPHSPLAQPWSFAGGHLLSALVGVSCATFIPDAFLAAAVAVAAAILLMHEGRCLHPPGGATALFPVLGGEAARAAGFGFVLSPVGVNVLILLGLALVINNLVPKRRWPLPPRPVSHAAPSGWPLGQFGLAHRDLEVALKEMGAYIDVTGDDLDQIYSRAMLHSRRRRLGEVRVAEITNRDAPAVEFGDELQAIWELMRARKLKGAAVVDRARRVVGIVTIVDFLKRADTHASGNVIERLAAFVRRTPGVYADKPEVVGQIMTAPATTVREDAHIVSLVPLFTEHEIHHVPVVDAQQRYVGMVTQSDLVAALYSMRAALS